MEDNTTTSTDDELVVMYLCNSCNAFYDGCAQCCFEMDHTKCEMNPKTYIMKQ